PVHPDAAGGPRGGAARGATRIAHPFVTGNVFGTEHLADSLGPDGKVEYYQIHPARMPPVPTRALPRSPMLLNRYLGDVLLSVLCVGLVATVAGAQPPAPSIIPPHPQPPTI